MTVNMYSPFFNWPAEHVTAGDAQLLSFQRESTLFIECLLPPPTGSSPFMAFLRHLLAKNKDLLSGGPWPGLSNQTVLTSVYFALLKLMRPYLDGSQPRDSLTACRAAEMFARDAHVVEAGGRELAEALPRIGGLLSVVRKEQALGPGEAEVVAVDLPAAQTQGACVCVRYST